MAFSFGNLSGGGGAGAASSTGGVQAAEGPELELIQTEGLGFLNLAGETKLQFVSKWTEPPLPTASLVSIASRKGLVAAAGPDAVHIATTDSVRKAITSEDSSNDDDSNVRPFTPQIKIPMSMRVSQLAFTADENYLILSAETGGGLAVYHVQTLLSGAEPKSAFELSTNGETVRSLVVNPMADKAELCALVTANGNLLMADFQQRALRNGPSGQPVLRAQVSSAAWSSRGKQLVAGCADGSVYQMTPDGQEKAHIPKPPSVGDFYVASISWLENDVFLVVHNPTSPGDPSAYHIVTRNSKASPPELVFQKLNDPVEPFGDKAPHHTILRLRDFPPNLQDVLMVASTAVENVGLLTRSKSPLASNVPADKITNVFTTTELADDSRRAQLPMSADYSETFPVGAALDLSSTEKVPKPIPTDEMDESPGPLPGMWVLNNEGVLLAWWVVYNESIRQGTTFPGLVAVDGGASAAISTPAPAAAVGNGPFSSPKPAAPAFGLSGTSASPAPAFGASAWGQPAAPAASPSRAPAFGAPSVLGGAAFGAPSGIAAAKPSVWGAGAKTTSGPAFGQTSFGAPAGAGSPTPAANAFSSFANKSDASPFGSAIPAASSDKPAAASPFGAFGNASQSGFAALSTAKANGSIFGSGSSSNKPFGSTSNGTSAFGTAPGASTTGGSAFGAPSTGGSAFGAPSTSGSAFGGSLFSKPAATTTGSGASPFGSTPFVLGTTFKADPKTASDNEKAPEKGSGGGMFGGGFGLSLADAANKDPAPAANEKDEDMDTAAPAEPAKTVASAPAAPASTTTTTAPPASLESTTPTTTPAPAGSRFFNPLTGNDKAAATTSLFSSSKAAATGSTSLLESSTSGTATTPNPFSGFSKPNGGTPTTSAPSLFGSKTPGSTAAAPSLFGKPSGQAATPSLFGKPSGEASAAPSLFGKPFGTGATGAPGTGKGLFGQASTSSGMFSGFAKPAEPAKEKQNKEAQDAPLPPDTTSKAPFSLDSSYSTTPSSRLSTQSAQSAQSPKSPTIAPLTTTTKPSSNSAVEPPNPFSKPKPTATAAGSEPSLPPNPFVKPKTEAAAVQDAPLPPDPFTKPKAKNAADNAASAAVPTSDAPLPPVPITEAKPKVEPKPAATSSLFGSLSTSSKSASTSKPFSIFSTGAAPSTDSGMKNPFANLPKEPLSPTTDGSEEDDFSDDGEDEEEEQDEDDEEEEELEEDGDDEGSGTDIGKDVAQSPPDFVKTPSFATQGSFTTVGAMDASVTSGFSHIEPSRSQIFGGPPDLRPPRQQDTSPRSPSPQRPPAKLNAGISAGRLFREESQRSFSAPGMASQLLRDSRQGRLPGSAAPLAPQGGGGQGGLFAGRRTARDVNLEEQRKADEARIKAEAEEMPEEDSCDVMDRELDQPLPPTLQLAECLYILDSDIAGGDTVSSQVEAVYRDINRMVLVLKLNSRNIDAFLRGHSHSDRKTDEDLGDADDWVLCDVDALGAIVSRDLPTKLSQSRVKGESEILADSEALLKEGSRLQVMHDDMVRVIQSQASPDQMAAARSLPLSAEQATQQSDLRRTFTKFMERLVEAEQQLVLLRTKVATLAAASSTASGANGSKAPPVPTVDAVMRTIARMTAMAEKRSGDIDVLEAQIRKLNLNVSLGAGTGAKGSPRREGSPFSTPQKYHQKRASVSFAPGSTQRSGGAHRSSVMYAASPGPSAGASTPTRRKLTGYTDQEKELLRQKRAGRQRTLDRLQKVQQSEGPLYMPMDE